MVHWVAHILYAHHTADTATCIGTPPASLSVRECNGVALHYKPLHGLFPGKKKFFSALDLMLCTLILTHPGRITAWARGRVEGGREGRGGGGGGGGGKRLPFLYHLFYLTL